MAAATVRLRRRGVRCAVVFVVAMTKVDRGAQGALVVFLCADGVSGVLWLVLLFYEKWMAG